MVGKNLPSLHHSGRFTSLSFFFFSLILFVFVVLFYSYKSIFHHKVFNFWFFLWIRERKLCDGTRDSNVEPICGRPLGLKFDSRTCHLFIADAYFGLLVVGPNGGTAIRLAISAANGAPFKFTNGLDIDTSTGMVYFTDSSTLFQRRYIFFLFFASKLSPIVDSIQGGLTYT